MKVPIFSQRDPRWSNQRLGTVDGTTIGTYGCAITSVAMIDGAFDPLNPWTPAQVDDWFTDQGGYADGNLVKWNDIPRLLPNTGYAGAEYSFDTPANLDRIRDHLAAGGLCIFQVGFGGDPSKMHFVVGVGFNDADIIIHDPWWGDESSFASGRYGRNSAEAILVTHYFYDQTPNTPPPAEAPIPPVIVPPQPAPATPLPVEPPKPSPVPENQSPAPEAPETPSQKPVEPPLAPAGHDVPAVTPGVKTSEFKVTGLISLLPFVLPIINRYFHSAVTTDQATQLVQVWAANITELVAIIGAGVAAVAYIWSRLKLKTHK